MRLIASIMNLLGLDLMVLDHTTLCRQTQTLNRISCNQEHIAGSLFARPQPRCPFRGMEITLAAFETGAL